MDNPRLPPTPKEEDGSGAYARSFWSETEKGKRPVRGASGYASLEAEADFGSETAMEYAGAFGLSLVTGQRRIVNVSP